MQRSLLFTVPKDNVATLEKSASVQDGVSRSRHALLNGDTSNYDWDSGYTCHQLGSGAIVVQLGQPYVMDSMKYVCFSIKKRKRIDHVLAGYYSGIAMTVGTLTI